MAGGEAAVADGLIAVEVVYARPEGQELVQLQVPADATVGAAITRSGLLERFPEIDLGAVNKVGVFGKLVDLSAGLRAQDRIEIYRPLVADPKEVRKQRARHAAAPGRRRLG